MIYGFKDHVLLTLLLMMAVQSVNADEQAHCINKRGQSDETCKAPEEEDSTNLLQTHATIKHLHATMTQATGQVDARTGCRFWEKDQGYWQGTTVQVAQGATTWTQCASKCREKSTCEFWKLQTINQITGGGLIRCYLLKNKSSYVEGSGYYTGPKDPNCFADSSPQKFGVKPDTLDGLKGVAQDIAEMITDVGVLFSQRLDEAMPIKQHEKDRCQQTSQSSGSVVYQGFVKGLNMDKEADYGCCDSNGHKMVMDTMDILLNQKDILHQIALKITEKFGGAASNIGFGGSFGSFNIPGFGSFFQKAAANAKKKNVTEQRSREGEESETKSSRRPLPNTKVDQGAQLVQNVDEEKEDLLLDLDKDGKSEGESDAKQSSKSLIERAKTENLDTAFQSTLHAKGPCSLDPTGACKEAEELRKKAEQAAKDGAKATGADKVTGAASDTLGKAADTATDLGGKAAGLAVKGYEASGIKFDEATGFLDETGKALPGLNIMTDAVANPMSAAASLGGVLGADTSMSTFVDGLENILRWMVNDTLSKGLAGTPQTINCWHPQCSEHNLSVQDQIGYCYCKKGVDMRWDGIRNTLRGIVESLMRAAAEAADGIPVVGGTMKGGITGITDFSAAFDQFRYDMMDSDHDGEFGGTLDCQKYGMGLLSDKVNEESLNSRQATRAELAKQTNEIKGHQKYWRDTILKKIGDTKKELKEYQDEQSKGLSTLFGMAAGQVSRLSEVVDSIKSDIQGLKKGKSKRRKSGKRR